MIEFCKAITWTNVALGLAALWLLIMVVRWHLSDSPFDIRDLINDPETGKASLYNLTTVVFAALIVWVAVTAMNTGQLAPGVAELLLGGAAIFVAGRQTSRWVGRQRGPSDEDCDPRQPKPRHPSES